MRVPLLDLQQQHYSLRDELRDAVGRVLDSQQFILGEDVRLLEEELARYSQTRYAVGCGSGSDALLLALMALDVKSGDEVVTTPFTFFATAGAVVRTGARPRFADIEHDTYNLDPARVEEAMTERTRALMPVHLYGQCAATDHLSAIAERRGLPVVEDAAQAIGAEDRGRRAGSLGAVGCFSFYPTKNLGAAGEAGLLTTNDENLAARLRRLRVHGGATEYHHDEVGFNSRLDTIQAAVLRVKLARLDGWSEARRDRAALYARLLEEAGLTEFLTPPFVREDARHIFHQYVVRVRPPASRDRLAEHLKSNGVGTKVYYPVPLHLQPCFADLGYRAGEFPESERAAQETLALPMFPELTREQQHYVVETLRDFFG
ncbi:MAG TPA: DegT/DnrJ/EryC1/StrS family aminotransferase [Pyrinomonadaceae bacterium]|jgi:dTDP-4-amino-4,6-dideoxygalactose transaminase|nr:DegT/DnrJ/EryC1/StrS family aminotransferase [Pyrinomonadaceae bacterium]